jgi:GNAT superfamily N-acetyltransferase
MLLPEAFRLGAPPDAFLAWDQARDTIAGLAAFHRFKRETIGARVMTVRTHRRQGIGSNLLRRVCEQARERGDLRVCTLVDLALHPHAEPFLKANGFVPQSRFLRAEAPLAGGRDTVLALRERLTAAGKIPQGARIMESRELPAGFVLRAYRELIATHLPGRPELADFIVTRPEFDAAILTVADRLAGMAVGVRNDGHGVGSLEAIVVAPEFRGGWGWANVLLLATVAEWSTAAGAHRLRFEIEETNWKVLQAIGQVQGAIVGATARLVHEL